MGKLHFLALLLALTALLGCQRTPVSRSGAGIVTAKIVPGSDGLTVEQRNIKRRIELDNEV